MTIIITALCGFAFGAADQYLGSRSALGPWASSASLMSAPWLLVAFVAGLTQDRPRRAMVLGLLATVAALVGYFAMTYSPLEIHPWSVERFTTGVVAIASTGYNPAYILTGLMTGPLFGLLGQRWRVHRSWVSAAIVAGVLCLEPVVRLRRAAALRTAEEYDRAAQRPGEVRELAAERHDQRAELAACMELGQDLVRATAGEAFTPVDGEVDLDGADEAFRRAIDLARELGDDPTLAAALREAGVVQLGRVRAWFVEQIRLGAHIAIAQRVAAGEVLEEMLPELPIAPVVYEASGSSRKRSSSSNASGTVAA